VVGIEDVANFWDDFAEDELRQVIRDQLLGLSTDTIASIAGRDSILEFLSVAGI
jgi:hypothetical protein